MSDMNQDMARRLRIGPGQPLADGGYALRVVQVPGRRSGRPVVTPVGVLRWGGQDYLVCPDRTRDWPRNLTAHPECLLWTGSTATTHEATPVDGAPAAEAIAGYLSVVDTPWARSAFRLGEQPTLEEITSALSRMAVFQLDPPCPDGGEAS